jgi:hypothetical protein
MSPLFLAQSVPHAFRALALDDNTVSVLVMLAGIIIGATMAGLHQQRRARKVKVERKSLEPRRPK